MARKSKADGVPDDQEIELFRRTINDKFKNAKFIGGKDLKPAVPNFTGSLRLDINLQAPFFEGAIVELYGETGSGKTTLALSVLNEAAVNKPNKKLLYLDQEMRLRDTLLSTFPALREKLEIIQADTGNEALQIADLWMRQFPGSIVVIDSVDSLVPDTGKEVKDIGEAQVGGLSRLMGDACRRLTKSAAQAGSTVIFLNQLRNKIGGYGNPETTPGGKALPFYASQRIQLRPINADSRILDAKGGQIGHMVRFKVVKNSVTVPFVEGEFPLIYGKGVDKIDELVDLACDLDVLKKDGNYILLKDETGEEKKRPPKTVKDIMRSDPKFYAEILKGVMQLYPDVFQLDEQDEQGV
jgi:recombination protein RecA